MDSNLIMPKIKSAGADIFYIDDFSIVPPHSISIKNKTYFRFCDFIFIPRDTYLLSQEQVIVVNQIRTKYFEIHPQFKMNDTVRNRFKSWVEILEPRSILEFGPGLNPFLPEHQNGIQIFYADFNGESVESLKSKGLDCSLFGKDSSLKIETDTIDLIVSIFVFHFDISQNQIKEFYRVINTDGVFIANVYKLPAEARHMLLTKFISTGFFYYIIPDSENICKNHEYWILYKKKHNNEITSLVNNFPIRKN